MKAFLNQSCDQGPNHTPCLAIWSDIETQLASNTSTAAVNYGVSYWNRVAIRNNINESVL